MKKRDVTKGSIPEHLFKMALPTIGGGIAFTLFNITDTYFVGQLGTDSLAAMGFTFPIVLIASAISMGISIGASSVLSRLAGQNNYSDMKRTATDGIILSILLVMILSIAGLHTMDFIFPLLGANESTLPLVKEYMTIWYSFIFVVLMPPVCDGAMRSLGDTFRPFVVMLICAILNIVLDPILIFGWFGLPAFGIKGAAMATVISRCIGMIVSISFIYFKYKLIDFSIPQLSVLIKSWKNIVTVGLPNVGVVLIPQLLRLVLTAMTASVGGTVAVAAIAVGSRIEGFIGIVGYSIGGSIIPIIGQNWGAGNYNRVEQARTLLNKLALWVSLSVFILMFFFVKPLANIFTDDIKVLHTTSIYLRLILIGSLGLNLYTWNGQILNAMGRSIVTLFINLLGTIFLMMPFVYLGAQCSFEYMLVGLVTAQIIVGLISIKVTTLYIKRDTQNIKGTENNRDRKQNAYFENEQENCS